ncbi:hypothetical protein EW146_g6031 [Bondarzewia mesenterica]|uniref:Transcription elongation factor n=1 Tax=Bondarzewia mesenterica TaxID=1095465 RepID=A0A4S4LPV0_9AGAM|nr:hypothetical protein EW146_g6031 [Bondarzewia mesenterica]
MSDAVELRKLVKALQHSSTDQETIDVLTTLKKEAKITEALLRVSTLLPYSITQRPNTGRESKAGLAVGKLRTHGTKEVSDLAKEIVKKWKHEVEKEKQAAGGSTGKTDSHAKPSAPSRKASTASVTPTTPTLAKALATTSANGSSRTAKTDGVKTSVSADNTRNKCVELIYDALASDSGAPSELILSRATAIEDAVLIEYNGTTAQYRTKIRQLFVNLKDKNNPGLRESVVSGDIPAQKFAKMTSQDMASEERKAADQKIKEDNLFHSLGAEEQQAETDAFQCGRCKQRKCRYRQAQTRSADEPMTTFVTCVKSVIYMEVLVELATSPLPPILELNLFYCDRGTTHNALGHFNHPCPPRSSSAFLAASKPAALIC